MSDDRKRHDRSGAPELPPLPQTPSTEDRSEAEHEREPERARFRLAVLDCPTCAAPLDAESADVVFYCTACRNGYRLDHPEGVGAARLAPVDVAFIGAANVAAERWVPFWMLPAEVRLEQRSASGRKHQFRDFALIAKLFPDEVRPRTDGAIAMTFAVPAFAADIGSLQRLIYEYTYRGAGHGERIGERLTGGTYGPGDAQKLAHYAFITAEIRKPDTLTDLSYRIDFGEARLLGVPAVRHGDGWRDGLYSVPF